MLDVREVKKEKIFALVFAQLGCFLVGVCGFSILAYYFAGKPYSTEGVTKLCIAGVISLVASICLFSGHRKEAIKGAFRGIVKYTTALVFIYSGALLILNFIDLSNSYRLYLLVISLIFGAVFYLTVRIEKRL